MKIIDLSYKITNNMPVFPDDDGIVITEDKILSRDYYNAIGLKTGMHVGTHVDVPRHLLDDYRTIDEIPIDRFVGNGVLLDVRCQNIIEFKKEYEHLIEENDIVLLYTGFANMYIEPCLYYNKYPVVGESLAEFLVSKKIKMLGVDTPSPDTYPFNIHKKLLANDIFIMENLTNLNELVNIKSFEVFAAPLKIKAEASLVRAYARV